MSILEREKIDETKKEDFGFKPKLGSVPDFDVPTFLPDLIGIADITFNQQVASIAPSSVIEIPDELPDIAIDTTPIEPLKSNINEPPTFKNAENEIIQLKQPVFNASVPPPPPPPMNTNFNSNEAKPIAVKVERVKTVVPPAAEDGISSLLEQIRGFGGNKKNLKSIEDRKLETKKKKQEEKEANVSVDMADLFKKAMVERRKFIGDPEPDSIPKIKDSSQVDMMKNPTINPFSNDGDSSDDNNSDWETG